MFIPLFLCNRAACNRGIGECRMNKKLMLSLFLSIGGLLAGEAEMLRNFEIRAKKTEDNSSILIQVNIQTGVICYLGIVLSGIACDFINDEAIQDCKKYIIFNTEEGKFVFSGPVVAFVLNLFVKRFSASEIKNNPLCGVRFPIRKDPSCGSRFLIGKDPLCGLGFSIDTRCFALLDHDVISV